MASLFYTVISCPRWRTNGELWVCFADKHLSESSSFLVVTEQILDLFQGARAVFVSTFFRGEVVPEAATELQ